MWSTGATVCVMPGTALPQLEGFSFEHIHVPVICGDVKEDLWLLDTGAPTSIVGIEYRRCFTRQGDYHALEVRGRQTIGREGVCLLKIEAKLGGQDLILKADAMLVEDWEGPPLLGLGGALDRLRFAVDPLGGGDQFGSLSFALSDRRL